MEFEHSLEHCVGTLLTNRLTNWMNQVGANQMEMIISREKIHNEKLVTQDQLTRIAAKNKIELLRIEERKSKLIGFRDLMSKQNDESQSTLDMDKAHQAQKKFGALMGVSSGFRKNLEEKENRAKLARTRFSKATRMTVLINSLKGSQVICTCSSLEVNCAKHDS
jgi:hypothetical protein